MCIRDSTHTGTDTGTGTGSAAQTDAGAAGARRLLGELVGDRARVRALRPVADLVARRKALFGAVLELLDATARPESTRERVEAAAALVITEAAGLASAHPAVADTPQRQTTALWSPAGRR